MKLIQKSTGIEEEFTWGSHEGGCTSCLKVDLGKPATFVHACAFGSRLLMEEMQKRQTPVVRQKAKQVEEWAKKTGAFREFDGKTKQPPKYVGE